ncbi:MAG: hypothetical protein WCQ47_03125 [bacterium]
MKNINRLFIILSLLLVPNYIYSGPIIIKLNGLMGVYSNIAIEISADGKTFVFGKFRIVGEHNFDVQGLALSFDNFQKYNKFETFIISPDGKLPVDISSSISNGGRVVEYSFSVFASEIAVIKEGGAYKVLLRNRLGETIKKIGFQMTSITELSGIPYIYEPFNNEFFAMASDGWFKGNEYVRLFPHDYEWKSLTADQNYESIINDDPIKHFDILFGQGLFEYLIKRNYQEIETCSENELKERQIQTLILLGLFSKYKERIVSDYVNAFSFMSSLETINLTLNHPRQLALWLNFSDDITRKVEKFKEKLPKIK